MNTGTNAADNAACANRLLIRFGICEARLKAEYAPEFPKKPAAMTSRARPTIREAPVAIAKIAVLRPIRRWEGAWPGAPSGGATVVSSDTSAL